MSHAIILREPGGPDALRYEPVAVGTPGPGQLRVAHEAIGVNFHDTYVRSGLYQTLPLPGIPGLEAAGVVLETGPDALGFAPGDRIAYLDSRYGGYAEERLLDAKLAVPLPEGISTELAASTLLKGLTASILATAVHPARAGEVALVHAAAGGVGRLLAQWLANLGVVVIGTAGSAEKAAIAAEHGCAHVVRYRDEDFAARVMDLTGGRGADVVYDAIGRDTFDRSLACLALRGHLVNYGQSSGPIPPFDISRLAPRSATLTRPGYSHYIANRDDLLAMARGLWRKLADGTLRAPVGTPVPLLDAARAHRMLEDRVAGPIILVP